MAKGSLCFQHIYDQAKKTKRELGVKVMDILKGLKNIFFYSNFKPSLACAVHLLHSEKVLYGKPCTFTAPAWCRLRSCARCHSSVPLRHNGGGGGGSFWCVDAGECPWSCVPTPEETCRIQDCCWSCSRAGSEVVREASCVNSLLKPSSGQCQCDPSWIGEQCRGHLESVYPPHRWTWELCAIQCTLHGGAVCTITTSSSCFFLCLSLLVYIFVQL